MIIFQTKHHADVSMFDNLAVKLIGLMGHSASVPGALTEEEVERALNKLSEAVTSPSAQSGDDWDNDSVSLAHRAQPLLELLDAANRNYDHVIWEKSLR
ncbi:DUF1840 domain-containing protein [Hydrogenovibrio sp. 3SP14C1]|uniref:DUF1840 domain-containing protein n=1 Tax=Hydrogenovibrio sp. 3SP14C1 TaxID=3038774 RepID=UPI0024174F13|nr:DUF1840 domain-containing protein [Hydrogenovibrio sp. 3SP14C1]MDG4812780.1 DUF1840 domain-containing protein [Hydrogenovibrio sp. 3SP14C1]